MSLLFDNSSFRPAHLAFDFHTVEGKKQWQDSVFTEYYYYIQRIREECINPTILLARLRELGGLFGVSSRGNSKLHVRENILAHISRYFNSISNMKTCDISKQYLTFFMQSQMMEELRHRRRLSPFNRFERGLRQVQIPTTSSIQDKLLPTYVSNELFEAKTILKKEIECPICYNSIDTSSKFKVIKCGHFYCEECVRQIIATSKCAVCREII